MKKRQSKIKSLIKNNLTLDEIKAKFEEDEGRLVTAIFKDIKDTE